MSNPRFLLHVQEVRQEQSCSECCPSGDKPPASRDINVLALVKGDEHYVFLFDDASRAETLRTLGRYASNPEPSFTWYDAAVLSQKIRHLFGGQGGEG